MRATMLLALLAFAGCKKEPAAGMENGVDAAAPASSLPKRGRSAPICARQDCATKEIVDDGCDDTGRCLSCVNLCDVPGQ